MDNYSVDKPLAAGAWNALDEGERMLLVEEAHRRTGAQTDGQTPDEATSIRDFDALDPAMWTKKHR